MCRSWTRRTAWTPSPRSSSEGSSISPELRGRGCCLRRSSPRARWRPLRPPDFHAVLRQDAAADPRENNDQMFEHRDYPEMAAALLRFAGPSIYKRSTPMNSGNIAQTIATQLLPHSDPAHITNELCVTALGSCSASRSSERLATMSSVQTAANDLTPGLQIRTPDRDARGGSDGRNMQSLPWLNSVRIRAYDAPIFIVDPPPKKLAAASRRRRERSPTRCPRG